jgi:Pyruvate/2-oxoacid:ferredoxin oxidoreductase delta subunit
VINSSHTAEMLRSTEAFHLSAVGHLLCADFTAMALDAAHTLASLSTALGVAAARLVGLGLADCLAGLEDELGTAHLTPEQTAANIQLARTVCTHVQAWPSLQQGQDDAAGAAAPLVEVSFAPPYLAAPSIYAVGNSPERRTGNWRQFRPVLDADRCTRCWICFVRCPEAAISWMRRSIRLSTMTNVKAVCCAYMSVQRKRSLLRRRCDDTRKIADWQRCSGVGCPSG